MSLRFPTALALALTLASSAWANYDVNAKFTCYSGSDDKLLKAKGGNEEVIAACLGVSPTSPVVADYALTFDSDFRELHVVRRCDTAIICDLSTQLGCEIGGPHSESINTQTACTYRLLDLGASGVEGTMSCIEKEKYSLSTHKYSFSTSCVGALDVDGTPCTLTFKSGRVFDESGVCK
jgi:hypothetical protein